jgi:hypothetical protein
MSGGFRKSSQSSTACISFTDKCLKLSTSGVLGFTGTTFQRPASHTNNQLADKCSQCMEDHGRVPTAHLCPSGFPKQDYSLDSCEWEAGYCYRTCHNTSEVDKTDRDSYPFYARTPQVSNGGTTHKMPTHLSATISYHRLSRRRNNHLHLPPGNA